MQYTRPVLWLLALALLGLAACVNPPDYPDEPFIVYEGISKDTIIAYNDSTSVQDSLVIQFSFTDGDGNISNEDSVDIFVQDSRSRANNLPPAIFAGFPAIPNEGTGNGISGDVFYTVVNSGAGINCIYRGRQPANFPEYPIDTVSYFIYILDRDGNQSNVVKTEQIKIVCSGQG